MSWLEKKLDAYSKLGGYVKPDLHQGALKLDSNENYMIPKQLQADLINHAKKTADVREYPLGRLDELVQGIAKYAKVPPYTIGVGNGSDQILDLILANFASHKTRVLCPSPTFGFFEERCRLYGLPVTSVPFSAGMALDIAEFAAASKQADILYIDSPNNPTGFQFKRSELRNLVESFEGLVIIDEAYAEFASHTISGMAKSRDNLVVVRTLSKSFGLAGLRLGYMVSSKEFADVFTRVLQYPYPLSTMSIEMGMLALQKSDAMLEAAQAVKEERRRVTDELRKYSEFEVFDSQANFVLFDAHGSYKRVHAALLEQGILVRRLGKVGTHEGCLRVTIGTKAMNSRFLLAVRDLLQ